MRCSDTIRIAALYAGLTAGPAGAACMICDELITLNTAQAACFSAGFDDLLAALDDAPDGRLTVNLDGCAPDGSGLATRGGLLTMPGLPAPSPDSAVPQQSPVTKSAYLLDASGATCLKGLIDAHPGPFDPRTTFDLFEQCAP